ncbi:MAG: hypothetical protein KJ983_02815, partial [Candidatus Omnitrophica bacterium]|nr:hypothetical protein [Candidatus Omnitrophota bacterium]
MRKMMILLIACAMINFGCSKVAEKVNEKVMEKMYEKQLGQGAAVDIDEGKVSFKTDEGAEISYVLKSKFPEGFPSDVYYDKDAQIVMTSKDSSSGRHVLQLISKKDNQQLLNDYKNGLTKSGWIEKKVSSMGPLVVLDYQKGQDNINIMLMQTEEGVMITEM